MPQDEVWTIKKLLEWTASFFKSKGSDSPRLEAEVLLAHVMNLTRIDIYVRADEVPNDDARAKFRELVKRRGSGEPVAYLVGKKEFYSLDFDVDRRVLIPRPETEQLVLETVEFVKKEERVFGKSAKPTEEDGQDAVAPQGSGRTWRICDVCTGSGCIAVALAKNIANAEITALDVSRDALDVARKNAAKHGVDSRVRFLESNLFEALGRDAEPFDVIVSNPPYVSQREYDALEPTVRLFEPKLALLGGPTGAELPNTLAGQAPAFLRSGGKIFLELSPTTAEPVAQNMRNDARWTQVEILSDYSRLQRYVVATRQ